MAKTNKTSQRSILAAERATRALELRKSGASYESIGQTLGVTGQGAYKMVKKYFDKVTAECIETTQELKRLELERLDSLMLYIWPLVQAGDIRAVSEARALGAERRKLLGLDAATKAEITGREGGPLENLTTVQGPGGSAINVVSANLDLTKIDTERLQMLQAMLQDLTEPPASDI